ncbi:PBP1A family penicillin-binding protein [Allosphingosinicella flava]|uniref:PBP1A family penicillin-binding protein n=1 Tax=Allosphingosinicella flava TaxID=2771430 RepID=A0A7T2GIL9_9SPHN|nr:PBP1A family penicillin-binding protein [Sphingosinicella flava]QPQ54555.1 PBP1A family penicillin-binding protein [Sphingosinicella flava]
MASHASSPLKRFFVTSFKVGLYTALIALIALVVAVGVAMSQLPSYQQLVRRDDLGQMIRVRGADGSILVSMGPSFGEWLTYDEIPPVMRDAMVAVEDRRFWYHPGVDPVGTLRGIQVSLTEGGGVRGVSTISQQLARNVFLTSKRSYARKLREAILALALERRFSKEQVLELYLNRVYFGGGAYGIDAASRLFFGHSAEQLSVSEAAIIAGLVKAPSNYSPTADAEAARERANVVLDLMVRAEAITPAQAAAADPAEVKIVPTPKQNSVRYFTDWVLPQLDTLIDETSDPIEVWTTLDPAMQRAADAAINANTPRGAQGALVSLDRDGAVRAMVGGKDYVSSIYNRATQAQRQPGSAFKLFVYLTALETGYTPEQTVVDQPVTINGWSPRNSNRRFAGPISLRGAFSLSLNTVSAQIGQQVGFSNIADMARRFGITTPVNTHPSMVLGTSDVRLIDMTRAFAAVQRKGTAVTPYGIAKVTLADGSILYQHRSDENRVLIAPWVAAQMTDLLQSAVMTGTGRAAQIGRPVAGKTGTTTSNKDGWFVGFSSGLTTGVWMGRDDARPIAGLQGGTAPARAFHDYMVQAVAKRPIEQFEIQTELPDWQTEPDAESWYGAPEDFMMVDPDGNPIGTPQPQPGSPEEAPMDAEPAPGEEQLDQQWLDRAIGRERPQQPGRQPREPVRRPETLPPAPGQRQAPQQQPLDI